MFEVQIHFCTPERNFQILKRKSCRFVILGKILVKLLCVLRFILQNDEELFYFNLDCYLYFLVIYLKLTYTGPFPSLNQLKNGTGTCQPTCQTPNNNKTMILCCFAQNNCNRYSELYAYSGADCSQAFSFVVLFISAFVVMKITLCGIINV